MKLLDIVQIVGVVVVIVLAVAGLPKRKALNVLLLIYAGICGSECGVERGVSSGAGYYSANWEL